MRFIFRGLLIVFFMFFTLISCGGNVKESNFQKVNFNKVVDGDTIKISIDGKLQDIKLLLVSAPKIRGGYKFSTEARKFAQNKLSDDEFIYLEMDKQEKDKSGRLLAYVWHKENGELKMLNDEIVREGFGRVVKTFEDAKYLSVLNLSQESAKVERKNIWSIDGYVTENGFKK